MSLPTPNLDDRRFQDLVDEAKRLIPRYCPEWTDHNVSDPGVTLIELFAYMVDMLLYRVNRVPEKSQITFMELMGIQLQPPIAAHTPLTFWLSAPVPEPVKIPMGIDVATVQTANELAVTFTTDTDLIVHPPTLQDCLTSSDQRTFQDQFWKLAAPDESFRAFSPKPRPGDAFYLCFKEDLSSHILRLAIDCLLEGIGVNPQTPPLAWEAWCSEGWTEADVERDETGGLNRKGNVILYLPPTLTMFEIKGRRGYWLRCRHTIRHADQPTYSASPEINGLAVASLGGMINATQATTVVAEVLGRSDGLPGQTFRLEHPPVLPRRQDETLEVQEGDGSWTRWRERPDFAESRPSHLHFTVDNASGEVQFGPFLREPDGTGRQYGAIPVRGSLIRFTAYRSGGGSSGNVNAGKLTVMKTTVSYVDRVTNRATAAGGRDAETLEHAKMRAPQVLRTRSRAVTSEDYEYLAMEASPDVARARCIQPRAVSDSSSPPAGTIRVLLVPDVRDRSSRLIADQLHIPQRVIQDVQHYLDERRLLATAVSIGEPEYRWIAADVRIKARREADPDTVRKGALRQLYRFLNPLTGGPDYNGWPFGRDLYVSQVYAVLQNVPGVEYIDRVNLKIDGNDEFYDHITLPPTGLIASAEHRIAVI